MALRGKMLRYWKKYQTWKYKLNMKKIIWADLTYSQLNAILMKVLGSLRVVLAICQSLEESCRSNAQLG